MYPQSRRPKEKQSNAGAKSATPSTVGCTSSMDERCSADAHMQPAPTMSAAPPHMGDGHRYHPMPSAHGEYDQYPGPGGNYDAPANRPYNYSGQGRQPPMHGGMDNSGMMMGGPQPYHQSPLQPPSYGSPYVHNGNPGAAPQPFSPHTPPAMVPSGNFLSRASSEFTSETASGSPARIHGGNHPINHPHKSPTSPALSANLQAAAPPTTAVPPLQEGGGGNRSGAGRAGGYNNNNNNQNPATAPHTPSAADLGSPARDLSSGESYSGRHSDRATSSQAQPTSSSGQRRTYQQHNPYASAAAIYPSPSPKNPPSLQVNPPAQPIQHQPNNNNNNTNNNGSNNQPNPGPMGGPPPPPPSYFAPGTAPCQGFGTYPGFQQGGNGGGNGDSMGMSYPPCPNAPSMHFSGMPNNNAMESHMPPNMGGPSGGGPDFNGRGAGGFAPPQGAPPHPTPRTPLSSASCQIVGMGLPGIPVNGITPAQLEERYRYIYEEFTRASKARQKAQDDVKHYMHLHGTAVDELTALRRTHSIRSDGSPRVMNEYCRDVLHLLSVVDRLVQMVVTEREERDGGDTASPKPDNMAARVQVLEEVHRSLIGSVGTTTAPPPPPPPMKGYGSRKGGNQGMSSLREEDLKDLPCGGHGGAGNESPMHVGQLSQLLSLSFPKSGAYVVQSPTYHRGHARKNAGQGEPATPEVRAMLTYELQEVVNSAHAELEAYLKNLDFGVPSSTPSGGSGLQLTLEVSHPLDRRESDVRSRNDSRVEEGRATATSNDGVTAKGE